MDNNQSKLVLAAICDQHSHTVGYQEAKEALRFLRDNDRDFTFDFDGNEYRIIADSDIWGTYVAEIRQTVEDCYDLKLGQVPSFIEFEIDWEQTAKNCYVDGYGHQFSGYDGSEIEAGDYWVFRTNQNVHSNNPQTANGYRVKSRAVNRGLMLHKTAAYCNGLLLLQQIIRTA